MRRYLLYIAMSGLLASGLSSCRQDASGWEQPDEEARRIYLSAGVGNAVSSRTPYHPGDSVPTMAHPLNVSVWASTDSIVFSNLGKDGRDDSVAIHTDAHFQSGNPQLLGAAIYPETGTVYFVGFHPKSKEGASWNAVNGDKDAQYTFTGKEDVMFAPQISGQYGTDYEQTPQFHFYHLLTWLRIVMVADKDGANVIQKEAVSDAWGKIKSLSLINTKNTVTIMNLDGATKDNYPNYVNFTPDEPNKTMSLYSVGTDDVFVTPEDAESYKSIPTSETEMAYVMCAPVQGVQEDELGNPVPEYTLHIKTEHREMDIPLDLKGDNGNLFNLSTMGRVFTILLNFKMGDVISVSTEISVGGDADWFTHGTGNGDLKEGDLASN